MSYEYTWPGPVATSSGTTRDGWRANRRRSFTCEYSSRTRYIVDMEHKYVSSSKRVAKIWIGTKSTNRSEFTTRRMFARSAELSLFTGAETVFVSGGRCFRVAVARDTPTNPAAARVGVPATVNARYVTISASWAVSPLASSRIFAPRVIVLFP